MGDKVIIAGPRDFNVSVATVEKSVNLSGFDVAVLVNGCATGVDACAAQWRRSRHPEIFPIDIPARWEYWRRKGNVKFAGPERNSVMASIADALIIIKPEGRWSRGTQSMYFEAQKRNLKVYVHEVEVEVES